MTPDEAAMWEEMRGVCARLAARVTDWDYDGWLKLATATAQPDPLAALVWGWE
jgi:hypothetical protein